MDMKTKIFTVFSIIALFHSCGYHQRYREKKDSREARCDTVKYVTEQPEITLSGFYDDEIDTLKFQILRNGTLTGDTLVINDFTYTADEGFYKTVKIPYTSFLKTDTLVVSTQTPLYYYISGYHHYAYMHYGMFGYAGSYDCRFSEECKVNGHYDTYVGTLSRYLGWTTLPPSFAQQNRIFADTPEFAVFEKKADVSFKAAEQLVYTYTHHHHYGFLFCEGDDYVFILKEASVSDKIFTINAQDGAMMVDGKDAATTLETKTYRIIPPDGGIPTYETYFSNKQIKERWIQDDIYLSCAFLERTEWDFLGHKLRHIEYEYSMPTEDASYTDRFCVATITEYYPNGKIKLINKMKSFVKSEECPCGQWIYYDEKGKKKRMEQHKPCDNFKLDCGEMSEL
jgi:antitoxin component YwqK of YwqJK toxin-antitoxin module